MVIQPGEFRGTFNVTRIIKAKPPNNQGRCSVILTFPTEINRDFYPSPCPWMFICSGYLPHTNPADRMTLVISGSCLLVYPGIVTD